MNTAVARHAAPNMPEPGPQAFDPLRLRRAFGSFSPQEKRHICENLGEHWGVNKEDASEALEQPLTEKEEKTLKDLNEFNFDDI